MCLLLAGCCPCRHLPVAPIQRDTVRIVQRDSVAFRDSIYVDRLVTIRERGDTVYVTKEVVSYRDRWRERVRTDTLWREREVVRTEYVERQPGRWEIFWQQLGRIFTGLIVLGMLALAVRKALLRK